MKGWTNEGKKLTALFTCAFLLTTSTLSYAWADSDSSGKAGKQGTAASGYIESDLDAGHLHQQAWRSLI